jgi:hypothetical protein
MKCIHQSRNVVCSDKTLSCSCPDKTPNERFITANRSIFSAKVWIDLAYPSSGTYREALTFTYNNEITVLHI